VRVPALVYRPMADGPHPLVLIAAESWKEGRREPWVQAMGISLASKGFVAIALDPPGCADRSPMGDPLTASLSAGVPSIGVYVWDLIRAVDVAVIEFGAMGERVGVIGCGTGGDAALLATAIEERFSCVVAAGAGHSQESGLDATFRMMPGVADLGDWANLLVHRAPLPILFLTGKDDAPQRVEETVKKLTNAGYRSREHAMRVRLEVFLGGRDLNRRMREASLAFFLEHLQGAAQRAYVAEPLPLTDGLENPSPANTEDPGALLVSEPMATFESLLEDALLKPYPEQEPDLIPWGKYGRLDPLPDLETIKLVDHGESPNVICLPPIDPRLLVPLGISVPDFYAQLLHLLLPGGPEGWEPLGLHGDALTAMIASVKTLMKKAEPKAEPKRIEAEGPVSSLTARILKQLRPGLEISTTEDFGSWADCLSARVLVPGARYRKWPWPEPTVAQAIQWTADDENPAEPDATIPYHDPYDMEAIERSGEEPTPEEPVATEAPLADMEMAEASEEGALDAPPAEDEGR
jgi:dienelactone hydrolase